MEINDGESESAMELFSVALDTRLGLLVDQRSGKSAEMRMIKRARWRTFEERTVPGRTAFGEH